MGLGPKVITAITVGTTATAVAGSSTLCGTVTFQADVSNSGKIYLGDSTTTTANYMVALTAGQVYSIEAPAPLRPDSSNLDLKLFYVAGSAASQIVHTGYYERLGGLT